MNAPRVSDFELDCLVKGKGHMQTMEMDLAKDLQDARAQLQWHQEMRALYNKEPE